MARAEIERRSDTTRKVEAHSSRDCGANASGAIVVSVDGGSGVDLLEAQISSFGGAGGKGKRGWVAGDGTDRIANGHREGRGGVCGYSRGRGVGVTGCTGDRCAIPVPLVLD